MELHNLDMDLDFLGVPSSRYVSLLFSHRIILTKMTLSARNQSGISLEISTLYHMGWWGLSMSVACSLFLASGLSIQRLLQRRKQAIAMSTNVHKPLSKSTSSTSHSLAVPPERLNGSDLADEGMTFKGVNPMHYQGQ